MVDPKDLVVEDCLCLNPHVNPQRESDLDRQLQDRPQRDAQNQVGHQYQVPQVILRRSATYLDDLRQMVAQVIILLPKC